MDKLTKLTGFGAAAVAIAPMLAANSANAAVVAADDARLDAANMTFPGEGGAMKGYLAVPRDAAAKLPAVIVIHANRGLNDHIRDVARRIALEGFVALAPDFLSPAGGTPADDEDKARETIGARDAAATVENAKATRAFLDTHPKVNGRVGVIGFCWGGGMVNALAAADPELGAGVAYYGRQVDAAQVPNIRAPLMLHYAGNDERINAGIDAYKAALEQNGKDFVIHMYDGAQHAFNNDTSQARYNKEAADLAWDRTIGFLREKLG
jgi:carboxymethylenebutenolidase